MSTEPATARRSALSGGWVRPVILAASCLILGFVVGWVLRGDGGKAVVLPAATAATTSPATTAPSIQTSSAPATTAPAAPIDRSGVALAVLNGSNVTGLAGKTGDRALAAGYSKAKLVVGNAPAQTGPSVVYFRPGSRAAARQVAKDLQVGQVLPLGTNTALLAQTPGAASSDVIVVLGSG